MALVVTEGVTLYQYWLLTGGSLSSGDNSNTESSNLPITTPTETPIPTPDLVKITAAKKENFKDLQDQINTYITDKKLYMLLQLQGEDEVWSVHADEVNNGLSTIKMYIMVAVYEQLNQAKLKLDSKVSRYGYSGTVAEALEEMIQNSNNEAAGALGLAVGGPKTINTVLKALLGSDIKSYYSHTPAYMEGGYNKVTMQDEAALMKLIAEEKAVSANSSQDMLALMEGTSDYFNLQTIPGLTYISQKTGYSEPLQYGVVANVKVSSGKSYVLALQIWSKNNKSISKENLRDIIAMITDYYNIQY